MTHANTKVTRGYGLLEGFLARQRTRQANRLIPPQYRAGRILDIGCGAYPFFLLHTEFHQKYGLDQTLDEEGTIRLPEPDLVLIRHPIEGEACLPLQSDFFDVVTMLAVFEHIEPRVLPRLLNEVYRVLKPNGLYVITTPARWSDGLLRLMARLRLVSAVEIEEHKAAYNHAKLASIFKQTNFVMQNVRLGYFEGFLNLWATAYRIASAPPPPSR